MTDYLVELRGESREVYVIDATSPEDARERWHEGALVVSEVFGMGVESVTEEEA